MTTAQVENISKRINSALDDKSYTIAFMELEGMIGATGAGNDAADRLYELKRNFELLKRYALEGTEDSMRETLLNEIVDGVKSLSSTVLRAFKMRNDSSLYFSTLRYENANISESTSRLIESYLKLTADTSMNEIYGKNITPLQQKNIEELELRIFNRIWVSHPLGDSEISAIDSALSSDLASESFKRLLIGAVFLGGMEYFQEQRLFILADAYANNSQPTDIRALVSLLLLLWHWRNITPSNKLKARLEILFDSDDWNADLRIACQQFLRVRDTERITRKINEEFIPNMMKLRPEMEKLQSLQEFTFGDENLESNPEWEEKLRESGIEEQMKALNEMQTEGADVMMSTFTHLKSFPFFHQPANWFRNFNPRHSDITAIEAMRESSIGQIIESIPGLCDSDRFSLALSMEKLPESARKGMLNQMQAHRIDFAELASQNNDINSNRDNIANSFVQDLNRFFKLYRRSGEFHNPFAQTVNLFQIPLIRKTVKDTSLPELASEFYMQRGYYNEALSALELMIEASAPSAALYQKAGYCLEKTGKISQAIEQYRNSELLDSSNRWNMRRLAWCLRLEGNFEESAFFLRQLLDAEPDNFNLTYQLGTCLMNIGKLSEALNCFFKLEFINPDSNKPLRPIAWCSFLSGDFKRAEKYYNRIIETEPNAEDYLNYGHVMMAMKQYKKAVEAYRSCLEMLGRDITKFRSMLKKDEAHLHKAKIDFLILSLVTDQVNNILYT